jgi:hypothetical protein
MSLPNFCPAQTKQPLDQSPADPVDLEEMAAEQNRCPETQRLLGGTSLKLAFRQTGAQRLAGDVSTGNFHPIVPLKFRKTFFDHFHNVAHPGRLASHRIISSRFVWRDLSSDVTAWARGCLACQRGKIHRNPRLVPIPIPQQRFSHLHVDLVGTLQYSNNFNYIFTFIDRTSKWMEAILHQPCTASVYNLLCRAGHNFRCPLISPLSVNPLINGTALISMLKMSV